MVHGLCIASTICFKKSLEEMFYPPIHFFNFNHYSYICQIWCFLCNIKIMKFNTFIQSFFIIAFVIFSSCQQELLEELQVYYNDFSTLDSRSIQTDIGFSEYNNEMVLGYFHNESFTLRLLELPPHNMIRITIDIYVHDSWDGNTPGVGGPDIWKMIVDKKEIVKTTFSNSVCESAYCLYQSYPENFIRQFEPKTGALVTNLPGLCQYAGVRGWTTKYRISHLIPHNNRTISIQFLDELVQENVMNPRCDESWSVSKIELNALNVR